MAGTSVVIGLDFGGTKIAVAVGDTSGALLSRSVVDSSPELGADAALERGLDAADRVASELPAACRLAAVGAVTFGIPRGDRIDLAPAIPGWSKIHLAGSLRGRFPGVPVAVATDAKAAAVAESKWGALAGVGTGIYVNLGTGIAAAIVIDGAVLLGANGAAGEIGYNLRSVGDVRTPPGRRETVEGVIGGVAFAERARSVLDGEITVASDVFARGRHDPAAAGVAAGFVDELALHLVNLAIAVNPARIVVGGGLSAAWDDFAPPIDAILKDSVPFPPEFVRAKFPFDAPLMGALAIGASAVASEAGVDDSPQPEPVAGHFSEGRLQ